MGLRSFVKRRFFQLQGEFHSQLPDRDQEKKLLVFRKIVPNSLTLLAVAVGLTSVPLSLSANPRFEAAVVCILVAGVLDGLDGPVARLLHGTSRFGAELDSLCDLINFGVAPVSLMWVCCMACRLARFNAGVDFNQGIWSRNYFMGVPAPAGAILALAPMGLEFRFPEFAVDVRRHLLPYYFLCSFLLISNVPSFSSKMINRSLFPRSPIRIAASIGLVLLVLYVILWDPWLAGIVTVSGYVASFPISFYLFVRLQKIHLQSIAVEKNE